ncbi:PAP2 family protein [Lysinibacillus yapensis]|uniref:PAP2 family protein n=1 Tax=Ureibacillus yapensis TaxID=2304605 RepID=A0A396S573_9BACL|nr:phosphatase PAP2 family protein [Lysinibacillus yapensis]RHW34925.1 PAP2 family protein [Lysinibacillus yapensis]
MKAWNYVLACVTLLIFLVCLFSYETSLGRKIDGFFDELLGGNSFLIAFHYIGDTTVIIAVGLILLVILWLGQRNYRAMVLVLLTLAMGRVLNQFLKNWIDRPRPDIAEQLASFSFPSGHAMLSLLYLFTIAYLLSEVLESNKKALLIWIVAIILALLTGLSRIAESRHFATDVIAGWSIGYTWFMISVFWYEQRKRKFNKLKNNALD